MSKTNSTQGPAGTFDLAALKRAKAVVDAITPTPQAMTIVQHPGMERGRAWRMLDGGHLYAFLHPDDIAVLPAVPAGVPVHRFDDEMRAVFVRGLDRLAEADAALAQPPPPGEVK